MGSFLSPILVRKVCSENHCMRKDHTGGGTLVIRKRKGSRCCYSLQTVLKIHVIGRDKYITLVSGAYGLTEEESLSPALGNKWSF